MFYKLDENKNVVPSSIEEWSKFIEGILPTNYMYVGEEVVNGLRVSTIFAGISSDFYGKGKHPLVFETMIFNNGSSIYVNKYSTWDQAVEGHQNAIELAKNGFIPDNLR